MANDPYFGRLKAAQVNFYTPKFDVSRTLHATLSPRRGESYGDDEGEEKKEDDDDL